MVYYENIYSEDIAIEGKTDGLFLLKLSLETRLFSLVSWILQEKLLYEALREFMLSRSNLFISRFKKTRKGKYKLNIFYNNFPEPQNGAYHWMNP